MSQISYNQNQGELKVLIKSQLKKSDLKLVLYFAVVIIVLFFAELHKFNINEMSTFDWILKIAGYIYSAFVIYVSCLTFFGKEIIVVGAREIFYKSDVLGIGIPYRYEIDKIAKMRVATSADDSDYDYNLAPLLFSYDGDEEIVGLNLNATEANELISELRKWLPKSVFPSSGYIHGYILDT